MPTTIVRVTAPHFVAGLEMGRVKDKIVCVKAAPILKWAVYKSGDVIKEYLTKKGWTWEVLSTE